MTTVRSTLFVALLVATVAAAQQPVPVPRDVGGRRAAPPKAPAVVAGRVTSAESGAPIRRAEVVATNGSAGFRTAFTDDDGRFELTEMESGNWHIAASKTGYSTQQFGQRRPFEPSRALVVASGTRATADFALFRAAAISGRIFDEYGEPLAAARVDVLRARLIQKKRYLQRIGEGDLTDDTGSFRIHSLPPGEYFVTASLRVAPAESVVQTTYSPTYYPGTGNFAEAQRVLLEPGSDAVVDFPVLPYRTARVSGTVLDASGSPADAFLNLASEAGELGVPLGIGGATQPDGTFTLPEVPPGTYTLIAELKGGTSFGAEVAAMPLVVYGDDVSGVTLVTAKPGTMNGSIVADAGVARRLPANVSIVARSTRASGQSTFAEPTDNVFSLAAPTGPFRLFAEPPDGWMVKAILVSDADVTDGVLDLRGQQDIPVRVVLTDRVSEVSGAIAIDRRAAPPSVVVFPYDSALWEPPSRYVRTAIAGTDGAYRVVGLPAAKRYLAVAVDSLEEGEGEDPAFLARIRDLGAAFDLADGEKRVIDLKVIQR
jgi:hypothetical protein